MLPIGKCRLLDAVGPGCGTPRGQRAPGVPIAAAVVGMYISGNVGETISLSASVVGSSFYFPYSL